MDGGTGAETETETETVSEAMTGVIVQCALWFGVEDATRRMRSLMSRRRSLGPRVRGDDDVFPVSVLVPVPVPIRTRWLPRVRPDHQSTHR